MNSYHLSQGVKVALFKGYSSEQKMKKITKELLD